MIRSVLLGALLLFAAPLAAQTEYTLPLSSLTIAVSYCINEDSTVLTVINADILGTDSASEIVAHEAVHNRQMHDSLRIAGHCPGPRGDRVASMNREIMAYCVSDSIRELRTHDPVEASKITIARLVTQFWGDVSPEDVIAAWHTGCPRYARKQ